MAKAVFCRETGRAVIEDHGQRFILEHDRTAPESAEGVSLGMFLQPAMVRLEEHDAGEFPYTEFHERLRLAYRQEVTFRMVIEAVDPGLHLELRAECAEEAMKGIADQQVREWVEKKFKAEPLPPEADKNGVPDPEFREFVKDL
ncbi:hypothetical protein KGO95_00555 [Patescibacteria group bacterium]|nr:hypothetical protein [Patescibacteria group bacterium]